MCLLHIEDITKCREKFIQQTDGSFYKDRLHRQKNTSRMKEMRSTAKKMLTDKHSEVPEGKLTMSVLNWILKHPDKLMKAVWDGRVALKHHAYTLLQKELTKKFPQFIIENKRKKRVAQARKNILLRIKNKEIIPHAVRLKFSAQ